MIRGHEENQAAFQSFITTQGVDAVIASLRLAFDSSQVCELWNIAPSSRRPQYSEARRCPHFIYNLVFSPTLLPPSYSACPSRASRVAVRPSTAFSRSCIVTQLDKWHWRRRCSLRVHPGGPQLACSCARRSVRQMQHSPIGLVPCVLPACCSGTRSAKYVGAGRRNWLLAPIPHSPSHFFLYSVLGSGGRPSCRHYSCRTRVQKLSQRLRVLAQSSQSKRGTPEAAYHHVRPIFAL